jgi:hypothetical protein
MRGCERSATPGERAPVGATPCIARNARVNPSGKRREDAPEVVLRRQRYAGELGHVDVAVEPLLDELERLVPPFESHRRPFRRHPEAPCSATMSHRRADQQRRPDVLGPIRSGHVSKGTSA